MPRWVLLTFLALFALVIAGLTVVLWPRFQSQQPVITPEARKLLDIAQDKQQLYDERRHAVAALKSLGSDGVEALLQLVPGECDLVTLNVIDALGEIGDPRALSKLRECGSDGSGVIMPGKLNGALERAIKAIEEKQRNHAR